MIKIFKRKPIRCCSNCRSGYNSTCYKQPNSKDTVFCQLQIFGLDLRDHYQGDFICPAYRRSKKTKGDILNDKICR